MPFGSVRLIPGVNVERTPTLLETGFSQSQLIRFKDSLAQKYGGWQKYFSSTVTGVPRDLHAWEDLNSTPHLAVGSTTQLSIITSNTLTDITPQTFTSDCPVNFTTIAGQTSVQIVDTGVSGITAFDSVYFNTPISVGGLILSGLYAIIGIAGPTTYTITAATAATSSINNGGAVPVFTTTSGSATVSVNLANNGVVIGNNVVFPISTTVGGVTIFQHYTVTGVSPPNDFTIVVTSQASSSTSASMNGGNAEFVYYINIGPPSSGTGYGFGGYGSGLYGGGAAGTVQTGTPLTTTDWTSDNWGEILLACPSGGGIYQFDPTGGYSNAGLVATAPVFNGGIFVSMAQQILVAWASTATRNIGVQEDPMLVRWSDSGDYTNFTPATTNQAGSFRIPFGSMIVGGLAVSNQNLIWTDLDVWAMNYQGLPFVYGFNMIGAGAGLASSHAAQELRGNVYWMGKTNFYSMTSGGVAVLPCTVWDFVFQNINTSYFRNVRAMPNTPFNEVGWLFPSSASANGECNSYVKFNITEPNQPWDYGSLPRSAWIDQTVLGTPISATPTSLVYQQEMTNDGDNAPINASFTTGYFYLAEGEEFVFVDQIIPDMRWSTYGAAGSASVQLTFNVTNYPGDTPVSYGPYTVNSTTEYISVRFRGRQMSVTLQSSDSGSFWRIGKIRYRFSQDGRR